MKVIKGKTTTTNPAKKDIEKELTNLKNKKTDFVLLEVNQSFIQAMLPAQSKNKFFVEVLLSDKEAYRLNRLVDFDGLMQLFAEFSNGENIVKDDPSWENAKVRQSGRTILKITKKAVLILGIVSLLLSLISLVVVLISDQPWYSALPVILSVIVFFAGLMIISSWFYKRLIPGILKGLSVSIKMPCYIIPRRYGFEIRVINTEDRRSSKIFFLSIMEILLIICSIIAILLWMTAVAVLFWYITEQTGYFQQYKEYFSCLPVSAMFSGKLY